MNEAFTTMCALGDNPDIAAKFVQYSPVFVYDAESRQASEEDRKIAVAAKRTECEGRISGQGRRKKRKGKRR